MRRHYSPVPRWVLSVLCLTASGAVLLMLVAATLGLPVPHWMVVGSCLYSLNISSMAFGRPGITAAVIGQIFRCPPIS